jgi:hypothetical protein
MTLMTAMTMNYRGSLNGVRHSAVESRDRAMGREYGEHKCDKARRCSRFTRPLGDRKKTCSSCIQLQRLAHHAYLILIQPVQASLIAQPWRRTRPQGLCHVSTFYTTLVKKSQEGNGTFELRRRPLP